MALRVAWLRATAAARKRKMADEANSKKQVRRERGQSIFAVQPKPMGGAGVGNPMASSVGLGMAAMPGPNMAMASGMPMPAPIVVQPHGAPRPPTCLNLSGIKRIWCWPLAAHPTTGQEHSILATSLLSRAHVIKGMDRV